METGLLKLLKSSIKVRRNLRNEKPTKRAVSKTTLFETNRDSMGIVEMRPYPLTDLIRNRSFDRFQDGLKSRFAAYQFVDQLTYGEHTDDSSLYLDFEYKNLMGRVTVWESGFCDLEVIEIETEKQILWKHYQLDDESAFHLLLADFFLYFRDGKELPNQ